MELSQQEEDALAVATMGVVELTSTEQRGQQQ